MASEASSETLEYTPTWVVAAVCTVIVVISLTAERLLHYLGKFLHRERQDALFEALQKLKEELMLLGFISLLLTVFQSVINKICIPESVSTRMLPCKREGFTPMQETHHGKDFYHGRMWKKRRLLLGGAGSELCISKGKVPLLSMEALHQLHIFIFVLAVVHVVFCATTMILGGAKVRQWKKWEDEIHKEPENLLAVQHMRPRHHKIFIMERAMGFWGKSAVVSWMMSFFKQFHDSVTESDYRALRGGFIMRHCPFNPNFNFHKYILRALEDDFRKVVGISWYLWLFVIIFLLLNLNDGWCIHPVAVALLLIVGAKLEHIITRLAQEVAEEQEGARVKPSDEHFWFNNPNIVLYLIHFILFQNAFEIAFLLWIWSTYGFKSCMVERVGYIIPRLVIGVIIQVLCSYSTLPLYAIVSQMGDMFKQAIFAEHLRAALHGLAEEIRKRKRPGFGVSSVLNLFGRTKKQRRSSGNEIQMQKMSSEAAGSSHNAQQLASVEGITASEIVDSQTQAV